MQLPWFPAGMSYSEMCLQGIMVVVLITLKWIFFLMDTTTMVLRFVRPNERVILLCEPANIPSNPSRKLKLSKTLFQREEFENLGFLFSRGHKKNLKKGPFENDGVTIVISCGFSVRVFQTTGDFCVLKPVWRSVDGKHFDTVSGWNLRFQILQFTVDGPTIWMIHNNYFCRISRFQCCFLHKRTILWYTSHENRNLCYVCNPVEALQESNANIMSLLT